jgi:hypothetical protein
MAVSSSDFCWLKGFADVGSHGLLDSVSYLVRGCLDDPVHSLKAGPDCVEQGEGFLVDEVKVVVRHENYLQTMIDRLVFFYPLQVEP